MSPRHTLAALGAERLAEVLLDLADRNDDVARVVARLTSGPESPAAPPRRDVSIADILRKGNLSVEDPGAVVPPTAQVALGKPSNSSGGGSTSASANDSEK